MGFLAPFMLWGAAAASIPIALHFFFRSRYRTVPWAAMKFLLTSIEQTSRRLRFQELLLLLVRVALLVLLAIALARPLSSSIGGGSGRDAIDAAFVIDNSMSMGVREADKTRLDVARAAALSALDHLPPHSTVQVITCSDSATLLGPRQTGNLDQARDLIQAIELTSQATDLEPGVRKAVDHLKTSGSPNKELYLFSDMQKSGWEAREGALKEKFKEFHEKGVLYMVRCGIDVPRNVSIIEIVPQSSNTKPGERVGFAVMVRNTGNEVVKNLTVTLNIDNRPKDEEAQLIPEVKPAETRIVILTGKIDKTGLRVVKATVKQDDLEADNSLYQVIQVREQLRILAIDGRPAKEQEKADQASSFYFLHWLALLGDQARGHYNLRVKVTTPRQASKDFFNESDLCVLFNVGVEKDTKKGFEYLPERFPEELAKWVEQGGGLLIFAGDNVMPEAYNRILGKREGILPLPIAGVRTEPFAKPLFFNRKSASSPAFFRIRDDNDYSTMDNLLGIYKSLDLTEPPRDAKETDAKKADGKKAEAMRVIMRFSNDKPALVSRRIGGGEVLLVATSADTGQEPDFKKDKNEGTWNDFKRWPTYIGFIDACLIHLLGRQTQSHNFTAGEALTYVPEDKYADSTFALHRPNGDRIPLGKPQSEKDKLLVDAGILPQAGIYTLVRTDPGKAEEEAPLPGFKGPTRDLKREMPFAIQPDMRETVNLETLSEAELTDRLGFKPIHVVATAAATSFTGAERTVQEWTLWVLGLVLLILLFETVLAWFCGRAF